MHRFLSFFLLYLQKPLDFQANIKQCYKMTQFHYFQEVDRYRTAIRKLAADLLHVRQECKRLEVKHEDNGRFVTKKKI